MEPTKKGNVRMRREKKADEAKMMKEEEKKCEEFDRYSETQLKLKYQISFSRHSYSVDFDKEQQQHPKSKTLT